MRLSPKLKTIGIISWIFSTSSTLILASFFTYKIATAEIPTLNFSLHNTSGPTTITSAQESIVSSIKGVTTSIQTSDARPIIISKFLETNDSPLKPYDYYGQYLTNLADKYNLDFRLLPSIMMQESNLCKKIPPDTHNCLGLGIHSKGTWGFKSYEENFEAAAKILRDNYINKGYITPDEIQDKYTPGSNGSWEFSVNHFMEVLETAEFK